jgi:hypothetical protein
MVQRLRRGSAAAGACARHELLASHDDAPPKLEVVGEEAAYSEGVEPTAERTARTNELTNAERGRWRGKKKPNGNSIAGLSGRATSPSPAASWNVNGSTTPSPKKSFEGDERNFPGPLMRFARRDVRDRIASQKNDHGASYPRYRALQRRRRPNINVCEISGVVRFSTFATLSAPLRHADGL